MSNIKIQDVAQRIQYVATNLQTVFSVPYPFFATTDLVVYQGSTVLNLGAAPGEYGVSGAGSPSGGSVTFVTGATTGDIITITDNLAIDRTSIYSATISNLSGADLNGDFNREVVMLKQLETKQALMQLQYYPYAEVSQDPTVTIDRWLPQLGASQLWAMNAGNTAIEVVNVPTGGIAPADATYITQTPSGDLSAEQALSLSTTGFMASATTTGVVTTRILTGTTNQINIANGDGSGVPTFTLSSTIDAPGTFTIGTSTVISAIINDSTQTTALATNISSALAMKTYIDNSSGASKVDSVTGTANQIEVNNADPINPIVKLPAIINAPGTFNIQSTTAIDAIIDDDSFATASATSIPTSESSKAYMDAIATLLAPGGATNAVQYNNGSGGFAGAASANSAAVVTSSAGVPVMTGSLTNGQLLIGSTGATPVAASVTGGAGISISVGAGTLTINNTGGIADSDTGFTMMLMGG